ncbi:hypothetical protein C9933_01085 [Methylophaga nitratireducenticrescens]|nr:hypothetical protein C9933_01085 [Methylophaga nitratireducenticrescens]
MQMEHIHGADWETCLDLLNRWDVEGGSCLAGLTVVRRNELLEPAVRTLWSDRQPGVWLTGRGAYRTYREAMGVCGELCDALQARYEGYRAEQAAIRGDDAFRPQRSYAIGQAVPVGIWGSTESDPCYLIDLMEDGVTVIEPHVPQSRISHVVDAWLAGDDRPWETSGESTGNGQPPVLQPRGPKGPGF